MKGFHPKLSVVAVTTVSTVLACATGCGPNKSGITNPFLAPDRVPAPSTRAIAPGTAQPYYPGEPLPVMQSAAPVVEPQAPPTSAVAAASEPKTVVFSNEPAVAVPNDDSSLRFELPKPPEPEPQPFVPVTAAAPLAAASSAPGSAAPPANVVPADFQTPVAAQAADTGPWRSPQVARPATPATPQAVPYMMPQPMMQPVAMPGYVPVPAVAPPSTMDVSLRAVPSPPPAPVDPSTPRIRIPGYPAPPVTIAPPSSATSAVSPDGFRPRSSMR